MQLSITTIVAALATFHIANASWKITAFSNGACTLNAEDINSFSRELSSSESGNCVFYAEANCGGSEAGVTLPGTPTCVDNGADIMSYKCWSD
ncbi:hypothetical protein FOXYSP1_14659 [Fusarium oxysporum f. sp. phaseoli]